MGYLFDQRTWSNFIDAKTGLKYGVMAQKVGLVERNLVSCGVLYCTVQKIGLSQALELLCNR